MPDEQDSLDLFAIDAALPAPPRPPAFRFVPTLSTLPHDLKLDIADSVYSLRAIKGVGRSRIPAWADTTPPEKKTLLKLSRTSREWHEICVPLLFREFNLACDLSDQPDASFPPTFTRYSHHIQHLSVTFAVVESRILRASLLKQLPSLNRLRSLSLALNCRSPTPLPLFPPGLRIRTLHLRLSGGAALPDEFFAPFREHLRVLLLESDGALDSPPEPYSLPAVTRLSLTCPELADPVPFSSMPIKRLCIFGTTDSGSRLLDWLRTVGGTLRSVTYGDIPVEYCTAWQGRITERRREAVKDIFARSGVEVLLPPVQIYGAQR